MNSDDQPIIMETSPDGVMWTEIPACKPILGPECREQPQEINTSDFGSHHQRFWYQRINPVEWLAQNYGITAANITFDPDVKTQYRIVRNLGHDGTAMFTGELIHRALGNLVNGVSYYKPDPPRGGARIHYTIGWVRLLSVFGLVELRAGTYPGIKQRVIVPVRCQYFYGQGPAPTATALLTSVVSTDQVTE